jgi:hypothetical protein
MTAVTRSSYSDAYYSEKSHHINTRAIIRQLNDYYPSSSPPIFFDHAPIAPLLKIEPPSGSYEQKMTHKKPSWRRNSALFVPLLQNRMAYDRVDIVAACPVTKISKLQWYENWPLPLIKHPPK